MMKRLRNVLFALALLSMINVNASKPVNAQTSNPALQVCKAGTANDVAKNLADAAKAPALSDAKAPVLYVVTTVAPLTNLMFNIGGNRVKIHGLIPEGADSHTYEPKLSDAEFIAKADLIFLNGLHLEEPTRKLAAANMKSTTKLIELGALTLDEKDWAFDFSFPKEKGDPNPHLWMNPLLALNYAKIMRDALAERDPAGAAYYKANYVALEARIQILDQAICDAVNTIPDKQRKLLTYHDSFAYFAPRYGMSVIGAIQPSDFTEPSMRDVAALIEQLKKEGVPAIFGSEVFPTRVLDQIAKEAGVRFVATLSDDDLPNQTGDRRYHSYLQMLVDDVKTITESLGGNAEILKIVLTDNLAGADTDVESSGK